MASSVSKGYTVIGPLISRRPPPGSPVDSVSVAGPLTGHVKPSRRAWRFVSASRAVGVARSSTQRTLLGASVTCSTRICWKPAREPLAPPGTASRAGGRPAPTARWAAASTGGAAVPAEPRMPAAAARRAAARGRRGDGSSRGEHLHHVDDAARVAAHLEVEALDRHAADRQGPRDQVGLLDLHGQAGRGHERIRATHLEQRLALQADGSGERRLPNLLGVAVDVGGERQASRPARRPIRGPQGLVDVRIRAGAGSKPRSRAWRGEAKRLEPHPLGVER